MTDINTSAHSTNSQVNYIQFPKPCESPKGEKPLLENFHMSSQDGLYRVS